MTGDRRKSEKAGPLDANTGSGKFYDLDIGPIVSPYTEETSPPVAFRLFWDRSTDSMDVIPASTFPNRERYPSCVEVVLGDGSNTTREFWTVFSSASQESAEIISRIEGWAGDKPQAVAWYRSNPIPAFGGRTAEMLVRDGHAGAVREYLDHIALGGFA